MSSDGEPNLPEPGEGKVLDLESLRHFKKEKDKTGIAYLSRIPPMMGPQELRNHLAPFGEITRVYLTPADANQSGGSGGSRKQARKKTGMFVDGWVEFRCKSSAKNAALALNGTTVGGKKRSKFYGELWVMKYLSKFKWSHLTERIAYEKAVREQRLRTEISQATREAGLYLKQVDRAQTMEKIAAKRAAKGTTLTPKINETDALDALRRRFRQRKPIQPQARSQGKEK